MLSGQRPIIFERAGVPTALPATAPHGCPAENHAALLLALAARQCLEHRIADYAPDGHRRRDGLRGSQRQPHVLEAQVRLETGRLEAPVGDEATVALIHRSREEGLADQLEELTRLDAVARGERGCLA